MPNYPKKKAKSSPNLSKFEGALAELEMFEEWRAQILPELRSLMLKGASETEILKKYIPQMAARLVTIALVDSDNGRALAAIKDALDRINGKPTETRKVEHRMAEMTDEQLDALLKSEMQHLSDVEENVQ